MFVFTLPKLHKHLHSSNSIVDSLSSYLTKHIDSFLTTDYLDQKTLLSAHASIITTGNAHNKFIASKLIAYYASLKQSHNSTKVFDSLTFTDHFLWNSIIKAHFSNGDHVQAIKFFSKMRFAGILPTQFTIPMVVSACAELQSLSIGMKFHGLVSKLNLFDGNSAVGASFVYMYSKCGTMDYASLMFDETTVKDVVVWTALVIGHVQNGESEKGFHCLCVMHRTGGNSEKLNFRTLEGGFQACGNLCALVEGRCLHVLALKSGIVSSKVVQSAILSMYSKCGSVEDARMSFSEVVDKDLISWTLVMGVFSRLGCIVECFDIFLRMQATGVHPDGMAISCLVSGFANSLRVSEGKALHSFIITRNYMIDEKVHISLLSMYCKFGLVDLAEKIFIQCHDQVKDSWSLMVSSYEKVGLDKKCIMLFGQMQHQGIKPDISSLLSVISSCSRLGAICFARSIHCCMMKTMMLEKVTIVNSLINMYGKCSKLNEAERLLNHTSHDITTWNSLISSYIDNGNCLKAIALFDVIITRGLKPNKATLAVLLSACAQIASLEKGKKVHDYIIEAGFGCEVSVATSLVDMYAKCGQIDMAKEIFDSLSDRDIICWNVMISCYGMHGYGKSAVEMFQRMKESDVRPNDLTFLAVLSACVHAGLVDEGKSIFHKMKEYSIAPTLKHYACMVDLYGRSGYLDEAEALVLSMPFTPDGGIWGSLLNSCKLHNNVAMGMKIANHAIEADPENDGYYILVSDFYGSMGMWEDVGQVRKKMKDRGVRKTVGWSAA